MESSSEGKNTFAGVLVLGAVVALEGMKAGLSGRIDDARLAILLTSLFDRDETLLDVVGSLSVAKRRLEVTNLKARR